jgi:hypothetical protein
MSQGAGGGKAGASRRLGYGADEGCGCRATPSTTQGHDDDDDWVFRKEIDATACMRRHQAFARVRWVFRNPVSLVNELTTPVAAIRAGRRRHAIASR